MIFVLFTPKGIQSAIDRRTMAIKKWEEERGGRYWRNEEVLIRIHFDYLTKMKQRALFAIERLDKA